MEYFLIWDNAQKPFDNLRETCAICCFQVKESSNITPKCESLLSVAKQCIPRGRRKCYVPCWDKERETLYRSFTRSPVRTDSDRAASSLLSRLQQKKQERWEEAFNSIDFSRSSRKRGAPSANSLAGLDAPLACARLGKIHRLTACEKRGTQDQEPRAYQARQQAAVRPMEDSNT